MLGIPSVSILRFFLLGLSAPEKSLSVSCLGDTGLAARLLGAELGEGA